MPMSHELTLELPDEVYRPLAERAQSTGQSVEATAQACIVQALGRHSGYGRVRKWAGAFSSGVTDAGQRHDDYIGDALVDELRGRPHA